MPRKNTRKNGKQQQKKERDPLMGSIFLNRNDSDNESAPVLKGFVTITPELLEILNNLKVNSYGNVTLDAAIWRNASGGLSGNVQLGYKLREAMRKNGGVVPDEFLKGGSTSELELTEYDDEDDLLDDEVDQPLKAIMKRRSRQEVEPIELDDEDIPF